jgi:hypothetical protein
MDKDLLAVLAREGMSLGVKLVTQAIAAGGMTEEEGNELLAKAQASWSATYADWKTARKEHPTTE